VPADVGQEIAERVRAFGDEALSDAEFDRLAREVFAWQFAMCAPYRAFCERRGRPPRSVAHWTEIPAVPQSAFKSAALYADAGEAVRVFETSGTTVGRSGRHHVSEKGLALYDDSMRSTFAHYVLPELEKSYWPRTVHSPIALAPSSEEAPASSLSYMIDGVCATFFAEPPTRVVREGRLEIGVLRGALARAERDGRPAILLGTSLAFLDAAEALGATYALPGGSRIMETGGSKGRQRAIAPDALRAQLSEAFGIPEEMIVNEYGMTEACSQFYDGSLREEGREKRGPAWVRALICDPETLEPAPAGEVGVVRWVDLANCYSISFLLTEDLARAEDPGRWGPGTAPFTLLGRAEGAEARGCSLAAEEWSRVLS
jgi:hypothetical protein